MNCQLSINGNIVEFVGISAASGMSCQLSINGNVVESVGISTASSMGCQLIINCDIIDAETPVPNVQKEQLPISVEFHLLDSLISNHFMKETAL